MRQRLSARIHVALSPDDAFQLFTPRGEREWAHGWEPRFPAPTSDDSEPGTVFETDTHGRRATWLVTERICGKRIAYAQVIPGERAGRITVTLDATEGKPGGGHLRADVSQPSRRAPSQAVRRWLQRLPAIVAGRDRGMLGEEDRGINRA